MKNVLNEVLEKIKDLNLFIEDEVLGEKFILIAIKNIQDYIKCEISPFIEFEKIKNIFIDIVIGEYLRLINVACLDKNVQTQNAVKSIKEGDTSITYFENKNTNYEDIITYFLSKKSLLSKYKKVVW